MLSEQQIHDALVQRHGAQVQERLDAARVAIAGLGGLGSNVAVSLTRIGVGHLHLVDFDTVDVTNLNRQQYFAHQIGMAKTEVLAQNLKAINPYLDVRATCARVTPDNVEELLADAQIVCEAFDVPENKAMLVDAVTERLPHAVLVAATGMAGYGRSNDIVTRKVTDRFWLCGDGVSAPRPGFGLMAPRVAICANHQANLIAQLIIEGELS